MDTYQDVIQSIEPVTLYKRAIMIKVDRCTRELKIGTINHYNNFKEYKLIEEPKTRD